MTVLAAVIVMVVGVVALSVVVMMMGVVAAAMMGGGGEGAGAVPDIWMDMRGFYNLIKDIKHYKHLDAHVL